MYGLNQDSKSVISENNAHALPLNWQVLFIDFSHYLKVGVVYKIRFNLYLKNGEQNI
jgi:hypothetical protein